jgi:prolipoprotein diacylglyceryltransferase
LIGDLLIIGIMWLLFTRLWRHWPGITFFSGLVLYSAMRFGVSYLRIDSGYGCPNIGPGIECPDHIIKNWMSFPQVVSTITFAIGMLGLTWTIMRGRQREAAGTVIAAGTPENPLDKKPAPSRYST